MSKRIIRINASALKNSTCFLRFWRMVIEGYKYPVNFNDVEIGSAFHIFAKRMAETSGDLATSLAEARAYFRDTKMLIHPKKRHLDDLKLCSVCVEYWTFFQKTNEFEILVNDGKPAVEVTFSNLYYEDDKYQIFLEGTIDEIGKFKNGCFGIGDYKVTSTWMIDEFFKPHELGCQLRFYYMNLKLYAKNNPDSFIAEICKRQVACFINGIFLSASKPTEFKRSRMFFFSEDDMSEFKATLDVFIARLIAQLNTGEEPMREGILNGACGGGFRLCSFYASCAAPNKNAGKQILKADYIQQDYKPLRDE